MSVSGGGEERLAVLAVIVHRRWEHHAVVQKWRDQEGHLVKVAAELAVDMQLPKHGLALVVVNFTAQQLLLPFHFKQASLNILERSFLSSAFCLLFPLLHWIV